MTIIDTTEAVAPLPVGYLEPAEQTGSDDETQPVRTAFNVGDLVQVTGFPCEGMFAKVTFAYGNLINVRLIFEDQPALQFFPHELKLIRRAEKPGYIPIKDRTEKWGMWRDEYGTWHACQPQPSAANGYDDTPWFAEVSGERPVPLWGYTDPSGQRVLTALQLALAKAAAR